MVAEIGWMHNLVIMEKCKDDLEREFYLRMNRKFGWTKNVLIYQIENQTYKTYVKKEKLAPLVRENCLTHNLVIVVGRSRKIVNVE